MAVVTDAAVFVGNVGDSRCILVRRRGREGAESAAGRRPAWTADEIEVVAMSEDHKPDLPEERMRIESAGLTVQIDTVAPSEEGGVPLRIAKVRKSDREVLGVSRAFGDYDYKSNGELSRGRQAVVCTPEIEARERDGEDMYLVLACDGVWDVMSNDDAGSFVAAKAAELAGWTDEGVVEGSNIEDGLLARVGDDLLRECLDRGSEDNMSVLIVALPGSGLVPVPSSGGVATANAARGDKEGAARRIEFEEG
ncbi:hypothetical protein THAOC_34519 [Thalassiosira oceanica]|uniref:PPM-type phosphatase domain-containing protein n=1 Tax=Thalassiosira oceanica TaxID=159749 RepID=K0RJE9_THAOC|nr:hypothetical protein THAOC_34519 [Thalassiosira oceanica]|eukprot:EJK46797.1 hypothetical protein THAOC_34519 [Thalassiosira oceanica]